MKISEKIINMLESSKDKELDHTDEYKGVKWESWYDPKTEKYDIWLYLKQGKTLVSKNVDPSPYNIKTIAWEKIDKIPASKKKAKEKNEDVSKMCDQGNHERCKDKECECSCHTKK